jgi:SepF-like predicted cell division protein (DUF552 family)
MQDIQDDIMEMLLSEAGQSKSTEDSLKEIEESILELRAERGQHPEHSGSISATLQSLEQLREGYLNLVEEEAREATRTMPELNRWSSPVRSYDLAAVAEG